MENGNLMFRPTGSVIQLMDGRVFKRNQKNLWEDINTGVTITEQQLNLMVSSASFSSDASGGGRTNRKSSAPTDVVVSLNAPFDDIFGTIRNTFTPNRTIITTAPVTLRLTFAAGTYDTSSIDVYKNDTQFRNIRIGGSPPSPVTLSETFANGDQLKFKVDWANAAEKNFNVTIEKIEPGSVQVVDTFNVSTPPVSIGAPFDDIVADNSSEVQSTTVYPESAIGALTIRLNFSNGVYNGVNGSLLVYKDETPFGGGITLIDTISVSSRPNGTGLYVLSQTFAAAGLKFGFLGGDGGNNFDVTVEKTAPGGLVTMDTFNVRSNYSV